VLADAIAHGHLAQGSRLPTHRELARHLGVTIATVTRAYLEAERRGLVRGEVGRGTFVRAGDRAAGRFDFGRGLHPGMIDLALNVPPVGAPREEEALFAEGLGNLAARRDVLRLMHYQPTQVLDEHRAAGCSWLARCGVNTDPSRVVLSAGSQHALFIALATLTKPGDEILTESLTYPGLKSAAELLHLRLRGVALDGEGMVPEALSAAAASGGQIVYSVPTLHNPTTATMSARRRQQIAEVIERCDLNLIEDDIHVLLLPERKRHRPLATLLPERTIYVANTDKLLAPALRVSYLALPRSLVEPLTTAAQATLWMIPPLGAELASHWIQSGVADRLIELRQREAIARQKLARAKLRGYDYRFYSASYHGWLLLPDAWRTDAFVTRLADRGVAVTSGETFVVGRAVAPHAVRLCLGGAVDQRQLEDALEIIRVTLSERPRPARATV
jgi:DNA-binding transcriptional MocR family regulator